MEMSAKQVLANIGTEETGSITHFISELGEGWYLVTDEHLAGIIIRLFSDYTTRKIIVALMNGPLNINQILKVCGLAQTSTYRKMHLLLDSGIIRQHGYLLTSSDKRAYTYYCIFTELKIEFGKKMEVTAKLDNRRRLS